MQSKQLSRTFIAAVVLCACGQDDTIGIPKIRPSVQAALPQALLEGGSTANLNALHATVSGRIAQQDLTAIDYTKECQVQGAADVCMAYTADAKLQCIVKQRLFCPGPTEVLKLLNDLDGRTKDINDRSAGKVVACMSEAPVDHTPDLAFPGSQYKTHYLQCKESKLGLGFGTQDDIWYVRNGSDIGGYLFSEDTSDNVEGYLWGSGEPNHRGFMLHIKASSASQKLIEISGAGTDVGFCALRYRSNESNIWIQMNPDGIMGSCDSNANGITNEADYSEICLDALTLDVAPSASCSVLKSGKELPLIGRAAASGNSADSIATFAPAATPPDGEAMVLVDVNGLGALSEDAASMPTVSEFTFE